MQINRVFRFTTALSLVAHIAGLVLLTWTPLLPLQQSNAPEAAAITLTLLPPQIAHQEISIAPSPRRRTSKYLAHPTQSPIAVTSKEQAQSLPNKKINTEKTITTTLPPPPNEAFSTLTDSTTAPPSSNETFSTFTNKKFQDTSFSNTTYWAKELAKRSAPTSHKKTVQSVIAEQNEKRSKRALSEKMLNKAVRNHCQEAYAPMGLASIPFLIKDSITDTGCVW